MIIQESLSSSPPSSSVAQGQRQNRPQNDHLSPKISDRFVTANTYLDLKSILKMQSKTTVSSNRPLIVALHNLKAALGAPEGVGNMELQAKAVQWLNVYVNEQLEKYINYVEVKKARIRDIFENAEDGVDAELFKRATAGFIKSIENIQRWTRKIYEVLPVLQNQMGEDHVLLIKRQLHDLNNRNASVYGIFSLAKNMGWDNEDLIYLMPRPRSLDEILKQVRKFSIPGFNDVIISVECKNFDELPQLTDQESQSLDLIFYHLISNLIKYSVFRPEGSYGKITLQSHSQGMIIEIADNGRGMSPEFLKARFGVTGMREDADARVNLGLNKGVGVSHAFDQIRTVLHGEILSVQSQPLVGTTISFLIRPASQLIRSIPTNLPLKQTTFRSSRLWSQGSHYLASSARRMTNQTLGSNMKSKLRMNSRA